MLKLSELNILLIVHWRVIVAIKLQPTLTTFSELTSRTHAACFYQRLEIPCQLSTYLWLGFITGSKMSGILIWYSTKYVLTFTRVSWYCENMTFERWVRHSVRINSNFSSVWRTVNDTENLRCKHLCVIFS